ncbi:hypothetical protein KSS87_022721 [Heliosperma pusillum]|nr:hypothetical protein KSS87_022721 [Heliosperma pusillum]
MELLYMYIKQSCTCIKYVQPRYRVQLLV